MTGDALQDQELVELYCSAAADRWRRVDQGLPLSWLERLASRMHLPERELAVMLDLSPASISTAGGSANTLEPADAFRVLRLSCLLGQLVLMVRESGRPEGFDAGPWLRDWLDSPLPALRGRKPAELLSNAEGAEVLSGMLARMQSASFS